MLKDARIDGGGVGDVKLLELVYGPPRGTQQCDHEPFFRRRGSLVRFIAGGYVCICWLFDDRRRNKAHGEYLKG
jgi:hypothetical protein